MIDDDTAKAAAAALTDNTVLRLRDLDAIIGGIVEAVRQSSRAEIAGLTERLAAVEQKGLTYKGVFTSGEIYALGDVITFDGSMWVCKIAGARGRPGTDPTGWQLCVKRGADGKDLR